VIESTPAHLPAGSRASQPQQLAQPNDSILEIVWRQRNVVGVVAAACLVLAVMYLLVATRYYSGYARLFVQQAGTPVLNEQSRPQQESENFLFTQKEIITSTPVVAMTLGTPGIRELKTFAGEDNLFQYLKKNLSVEVGKKDDLLSVQFDTPYRDDAQKIVAAVVDSYVNYNSKHRREQASSIVGDLKQEHDKRVSELRRKQDELTAFRQANGIFSGTDEKTNVGKQRLETLSSELTKAQLENIAAASAWDDVKRTILNTTERARKFEQMKSSAGGIAPSAIDDTTLRTQMIAAQAMLQDALNSGRYGINHPIVRRYQDTVDTLNVTYALAVWRRAETGKAREADLQRSFEEQQKVAIGQNRFALEDARLQAEVTRLSGLADELDNRLRTVSLTTGETAPSITVLEPPSASKAPTRPYTGRTLGLALIAGLVLGCGAACVRDWYDYRLRSADEVKATLGVTVLGLIPRVADENSPIARGQKIHIDPQSEAAEAYRSLRTAVHFGLRDREARTILVTSPERGDGKTTCASNFAISMAQLGRRVLLIDADLRAPMQDLIFGINGRVGLANVVAGKESADGAIRHTGIENLDLLPAGVAQRNPSELLNSQKFIEVIESLAEKYDVVVIDSPPMLAVTDARIIAASSDATILVLRAGKSNRKLGELSIDGLVSVGANLLGAVVNDIQSRRYRYYGSYGSYGYGNNGRSDRSVTNEPDGSAVAAGGNAGGNGKAGHAREEDFPVVDEGDTSLAIRGRLT
jgi:capsular exopolysaccharide synthesis family protein